MRSRLTYANVASTIALFLALTGGVVYAASKIGTSDLQRQAVTEKKIAPRAVKNGKLAAGAVKTQQIADAAVGDAQVKDDSIQPSKLTFPVFYVATPTGGSQAVTGGPDPYPLSGGQWTQGKDAVNVVFGSGTATLAYDGSGSGQCQVFFDIRIDGQQTGGGQLQTDSTTPVQVTQQIGAAPGAGPTSPTPRSLTVQVGSNGDCEAGSTIDSTRFQVLNFG
jgi:hypothetical protein